MIGHGTGSIRDTFKKTATGTGTSAVVSVNPHNQTFAVAIQLGLVGALLLFAMWIAHFSLFFCGGGIASWLGLLLVAQNVIGSLANSHLFDFTHGWVYCIGVGVCGGIATRQGVPLSVFDVVLQGGRGEAVNEQIELPAHPRILVIALRRLGDVLLTTPLIRSLRRAWPLAKIDILVFSDTAAILEGNPDIDDVIHAPQQAERRAKPVARLAPLARVRSCGHDPGR